MSLVAVSKVSPWASSIARALPSAAAAPASSSS
jgi:hypothetical protein